MTLKRAHNNYLEVRSGPSEFRIVGLPAEDFPALPRFEKVAVRRREAARTCSSMIERTFFAVSNDETRYNLNGVFFEPAPEVLRLVATDGHRLSLAERAMGGTFGLKRGVILPKKGLQELKKLLAEAVEAGAEAAETKLGFVENSAIFRPPGRDPLDAAHRGALPGLPAGHPEAGREGRPRRPRPLPRDAAPHLAPLHRQGARGEARARARGRSGSSRRTRTSARRRRSVPVEYAGRAAQDRLQRALPHGRARRRAERRTSQLELADDLSPGVLRGGDEKDQGFTAVVMPMRI